MAVAALSDYVVRAVAQEGPAAPRVTVPMTLTRASAAAAAALPATVVAAVDRFVKDGFVALAQPRSMPAVSE